MEFNSFYKKPHNLSYFEEPYDGLKMMHHMLERNNYNLILKIAKYNNLDLCDTETLLIDYWKPRYYIPNIEYSEK